MENEQNEEPSQEPIQNPGAEPPTGGGTDWKAMARKWERLAKSNSKKAKSYDELQEQSKTELQRAQEKAKRAEDELAELKAKAELAETRAKVAKESGVPAELIFGADEGEMEANAKALAAWGKPSSAPRTRKPGSFSADAGDGRDAARRELARQLFGSGE